MKILVGIKRALDYAIKPRVRADGKWMETDGLKHSMNPFDEIALEEALRIREKGQGLHEVAVVSCGGQKSMETIRSALAMGADKGILIDSDGGASISPNDGMIFIYSHMARNTSTPYRGESIGRNSKEGKVRLGISGKAGY